MASKYAGVTLDLKMLDVGMIALAVFLFALMFGLAAWFDRI